MSASVMRQLVLKDLFLLRWMVAGSMAGGAVGLVLMASGGIPAYVGGVLFICTLVILNIVLVMSGVVQERKDKVLLFVLSLPVSTAQYVRAKVLANAIAFTVPWLVLTAAGVGVVMASPIPDGLIPFWVTVLVYLLAYYFVLLAVAISTDASGWHATAITIGNVSVNLLIPYLLRLPSVVAHHNAPRPVWTADILAINGIEIVVGVAALALALRLRSRRTDHV